MHMPTKSVEGIQKQLMRYIPRVPTATTTTSSYKKMLSPKPLKSGTEKGIISINEL